MKTDKFGRIAITEQEAFDLLYNGKLKNLADVAIEGNIDHYNHAVQSNADKLPELKLLENLDISLKDFDDLNQTQWFMPEEYKNMDIEGYLVYVCPKQNYQRMIEEIRLFKIHGMLDLLKYMKYLVDVMREHRIVWGVGRGSSVASYVLYLIGVHKIDSIKYNLDIHEFLKEK